MYLINLYIIIQQKFLIIEKKKLNHRFCMKF